MTSNLLVLFTDVHDFGRVMQEFENQASLRFLDEMYRRLGDEAVSRGGTIIKYLGDALLAVFGLRASVGNAATPDSAGDAQASAGSAQTSAASGNAPPQTSAEIALSAIEAAIAMRAVYAQLVTEHAIRTETDLEVGIAVGPCETGTIGHESMRAFDVFGECVNEAAMIGHHRGVAVTDAVRALLADRSSLRFTRLPDRPLKWRDAPLVTWEVEHAGQAGPTEV